MIELNRIYNEDCIKTISRIPDEYIDMILTSPPHDSLRPFNGYIFNFKPIARGLYRIIKPGGIIVWIVGDETVNCSETCTSFKQALYFRSLGLNLHDTMIYQKHCMPTDPRLRYYQRFDYMFVLSKGRPTTYNPIHDVKSSDVFQKHGVDRRGNDRIKTDKQYQSPFFTCRGNVWEYDPRHPITDHPAEFPEDLAYDHIISWSNPGEIVYDPFIGSGTTAVVCNRAERQYIGSEISIDYCRIANNRINDNLTQGIQLSIEFEIN